MWSAAGPMRISVVRGWRLAYVPTVEVTGDVRPAIGDSRACRCALPELACGSRGSSAPPDSGFGTQVLVEWWRRCWSRSKPAAMLCRDGTPVTSPSILPRREAVISSDGSFSGKPAVPTAAAPAAPFTRLHKRRLARSD
jgi:hypothetical protein